MVGEDRQKMSKSADCLLSYLFFCLQFICLHFFRAVGNSNNGLPRVHCHLCVATFKNYYFLKQHLDKEHVRNIFALFFQPGSLTLITLLTNSKEKRSAFTFQNQNILSTTLQLQGHKGRCVQFGTCVKHFIFNASCELHRPAFMTLEPIR